MAARDPDARQKHSHDHDFGVAAFIVAVWFVYVLMGFADDFSRLVDAIERTALKQEARDVP